MSLKRYYNIDSITGNTPTFGEDFSPKVNGLVESKKFVLTQNDVRGRYLGDISVNSVIESHIYADNNLLNSTSRPINYTTDSYPSIIINPEKELRDSGIKQGVYSLNYNFLHKFAEGCRISEISGDRTEIRLTGKRQNSFQNLSEIYFDNSTLNSFAYSGYLKDFVLNFGGNELINIINLDFNGPRSGEYRETLAYPTGVFGQRPTVWVPIDSKFETLDTWAFMVEVYSPQSIAIDGNVSDALAGYPTGRVRRYLLKRNLQSRESTRLIWQAGSNIFGAGEYPTDFPTELNRVQLTNPISGTSFGITYNSYDFTILESTDVIVKLDKPLSTSYGIGAIVSLDGRISRSYVEKIIAFPSIKMDNRPDFSEPNYTFDMSEFKGADATNFQTWNTLLDSNPTTSQQLISYYFSGSLGNVKLNIDYSDFENFVHFSSATERVENFHYKLRQIETYNSRINVLQTVSGSDALTNISQSIVRRDRIVGGFDEFEHYLYYSTDSNNYTHWSSSAFSIEPYPKSSTFPHILYPTTSPQGEEWYSGVYSSASLYDEFNDARLRNMIPIHLQEDERNAEYITFVDMIGQHFDIQWTYIKSLTDINRREEHPKDGMADGLLKSIADSFGWKLSNGYSDVSLWKYALGTEEDGSLYQTGSLETKARQQIVHETWRRIVNNIPLLYKTKGTARSIKAILSTYGIPQAFLKIREFGGPTIPDRKNVYEHDRFVYKLQSSPSKYISNPWDSIQGDVPDSIEIIGKMPKADYHIFRLNDGSKSIDYFWDFQNDYARIRMNVDGVDITSSVYVPYKQRREVVFVMSSGSGEIKAAWVDDWGKLLANPTASVANAGSTFNTIWTSTGTLQVPGPTTDSNIYNYETASIQEIRYYRDKISNEIVREHAANREAYFSDDNTTDLDIDTSYDKLSYRIFPDYGITTNSSSISSQHPNQRFTSSDSGFILSASLVNMTSVDLVGEVDTQFTRIPSVGALNLMNNKIRIESASLNGNLDPDTSREVSQYDYAPNDSNLLGTYFTTTDTVNFDIFNSEGYFEIDDWVGDPDYRYNSDYPLMKFRAKNYFQKYTTGTALDIILDMLSRYDMSVFTQIQQLLPARVDWHKGILIEPHILERNKYRRPRDISYSKQMYDGTIRRIGNSLTGSKHDYTSSVDLYNYSPSVYKRYIPTLSSSVQCTTPSSEYITSSTPLPSYFGDGTGDYLQYNSTRYDLVQKISLNKFEIDTQLSAFSGQTGTLYYTGSFDYIVPGVQTTTISSSTQYQEYTASVQNDNNMLDGTNEMLTSSFSPISGSIYPFLSPVFHGKTIFMQFIGFNGIPQPSWWPNGFNGGGTDVVEALFRNDGRIGLTGGNQFNFSAPDSGPFAPGTFTFEIRFSTSSTVDNFVSSNIVTLQAPYIWPANAAYAGELYIEDGVNNTRHTVLERIDNSTIKIDTSSYAPNTSGSWVYSELEYSSSATSAINFTIGDPTAIVCESSSTYIDRLNGYWDYSPTGSTILNSRPSRIYKEPKYFYTSSSDATLKLPSSSSMVFTQVQDTRLPLSMENLYYNGCRITSDSLTTDSEDTPDGGPVVEITKVDSNVLVYSTQAESDSGTIIGTSTQGNVRKTPDDVLVSVNLKNKKKSSSTISKVNETNAFSPLTFSPSNFLPILRPARSEGGGSYSVAKSVSSGYKIYGGNLVYLYNGNFNGDWSTLTRVYGAKFDLYLNNVKGTEFLMLPSSSMRVRNVTIPGSGLIIGQTSMVINRVYVVRKQTGEIVWTTENPVYSTFKAFNIPYRPFDLEVRIIIAT